MTRDDFEKLGDLHKSYEARTENTLLPGCPVIVRLDGRTFSKFTKGLAQPYDERMSMCMIDLTKYLVHESNAQIGYCQSDEITLGFLNSLENPIMFSGRVQKLVSVLAGSASAKFNRLIQESIPSHADKLPVFDARVFQYPNLDLACESFLWRETDATRNSLSMAASSLYKQTELHKAGFKAKHDMLMAKGVNWNNYPAFFKRGAYVGKRSVQKALTQEELKGIPLEYREEGKIYIRNIVCDLELEPYTKVLNVQDVFFFGISPVYN